MEKNKLNLEFIADWIKNDFTSGYYPYWQLSFNKNIQPNELSEATLQHIGCLVSDGYIEGEVIEDNNNGWWKIIF